MTGLLKANNAMDKQGLNDGTGYSVLKVSNDKFTPVLNFYIYIYILMK